MDDHVDKRFQINSNLSPSEYEKHQIEKKNRYNKNKTTKTNLHKIIDTYLKNLPKSKPAKLVLCHGKNHKKKITNSLLVDYEVNTNPDIVMDIWDESRMKLFPHNSFDIIKMEHCSVINMNDEKWLNLQKKKIESRSYNIFDYNQQLWKNCKKILKKTGYIEINYLVEVYYKNKYMKIDKDKSKWIRDFNKLSKKMQNDIINEVINELNKLGYSNVIHKNKYNKNYLLIGL